MYLENKGRVLVADGPMGTMIQQLGLDASVCPELWNEKDPQAIKSIHQAYVDKGARLLTTNTFGASPLKLKEYGLEDACYDLNKKGAQLASQVAQRAAKTLGQGAVLVAGDIGPSGALLEPMGDLSLEELVAAYQVQVRGLLDGGAQVIIIETMMEILELKAAVYAVRAVDPSVEIIGQMTFGEGGRTVMGTSPEIAATVMESLGLSLVGVNCSTGPEGLLGVVQAMGRTTPLYLSVQPNAGLPQMEEGRVVYRQTPEHMASFVADFIQAGALMVGGCCGNRPAHIEAISWAAKSLVPKPRPASPLRAISSRQHLLSFSEGPWGLARLNLPGDRTEEGPLSLKEIKGLLKGLKKQVKASSSIRGICFSLEEKDLDAAGARALMLGLKGPLSLPLLLSARLGKWLELMMRLSPGNPMITDLSLDRLEDILALAKAYGASLALSLGQGPGEGLANDQLKEEGAAFVKACQAAGLDGRCLALDVGYLLAQDKDLGDLEALGLPLMALDRGVRPAVLARFLDQDKGAWLVADFSDERLAGIF